MGRTQTLLARKHWGVDLGSVLERLPSGRLIQNERTDARSCGIRELVSAHPWASNIDLQIYLEGFDAGERFALYIPGTREHTCSAIEASLPHQDKSADKGHISEDTPAGVTRNEECTRREL